jgi:hypothetical protein
MPFFERLGASEATPFFERLGASEATPFFERQCGRRLKIPAAASGNSYRLGTLTNSSLAVVRRHSHLDLAQRTQRLASVFFRRLAH